VAAAQLLHGEAWLLIAVAAAAVLGHVFTCFHGFKGGKAVATSLGALIALVPLLAGLTFAVWLAVWLLGWTVFRSTRSGAVAPASVLASLAVPPIRLLTEPAPWSAAQVPVTGFLIALAVLVVVKHHSNIRRMLVRS
jgi:glycerol-3-phosphate acyltransferase PlsY